MSSYDYVKTCVTVISVISVIVLLLTSGGKDGGPTESAVLLTEPTPSNVAKDTCHMITSSDVTRYTSRYAEMENTGFAEFLRQYFLIGPPPPNLRYIPKGNNPDRSQAGQSAFVDKLLRKKRGGFFVECGASNGVGLSNSIFLETERNWTGLLIEANPSSFRSLVSKHRNVYSMNACLSTTNTTSIMDFVVSGVLGGLTDDRHNPNTQHVTAKSIPVPCVPLYGILRALGVTHVDYFSLDVEGSELKVLATIPFDKVTFDVITVEYVVWYYGRVHEVETLARLKQIRTFFQKLGKYEEAGIRPWENQLGNITAAEINGLDVVFKRVI